MGCGASARYVVDPEDFVKNHLHFEECSTTDLFRFDSIREAYLTDGSRRSYASGPQVIVCCGCGVLVTDCKSEQRHHIERPFYACVTCKQRSRQFDLCDTCREAERFPTLLDQQRKEEEKRLKQQQIEQEAELYRLQLEGVKPKEEEDGDTPLSSRRPSRRSGRSGAASPRPSSNSPRPSLPKSPRGSPSKSPRSPTSATSATSPVSAQLSPTKVNGRLSIPWAASPTSPPPAVPVAVLSPPADGVSPHSGEAAVPGGEFGNAMSLESFTRKTSSGGGGKFGKCSTLPLPTKGSGLQPPVNRRASEGDIGVVINLPTPGADEMQVTSARGSSRTPSRSPRANTHHGASPCATPRSERSERSERRRRNSDLGPEVQGLLSGPPSSKSPSRSGSRQPSPRRMSRSEDDIDAPSPPVLGTTKRRMSREGITPVAPPDEEAPGRGIRKLDLHALEERARRRSSNSRLRGASEISDIDPDEMPSRQISKMTCTSSSGVSRQVSKGAEHVVPSGRWVGHYACHERTTEVVRNITFHANWSMEGFLEGTDLSMAGTFFVGEVIAKGLADWTEMLHGVRTTVSAKFTTISSLRGRYESSDGTFGQIVLRFDDSECRSSSSLTKC
eukprot:TRINITY_DN31672_c0_g1_i1.p1 TRINITY_DN31672_c0_g1~~TRINITY_DN31672_c0_g1_i1.p1  ORF type:complete len:616 (-),score=74.43 TRINITY_DN31672_c0_g1_i1:222-2069(-)